MVSSALGSPPFGHKKNPAGRSDPQGSLFTVFHAISITRPAGEYVRDITHRCCSLCSFSYYHCNRSFRKKRPRYYSSLAVQQNRQFCQSTIFSVIGRGTLNVEVVADFVNGSCLTTLITIEGFQHIAFLGT